jgi:hypothetical protein
MSFDIFVCTMTEGDADFFDRSIAERAFEFIVEDLTGDQWALKAPGGGPCSGTVFIDDERKISGFSVNRPPGYEGFPEFWDAIFEVLRQTRAIVVWPGDSPSYCVANPDAISSLTPDFVEDFGPTVLVTSGLEIAATVERS